MDEHSVAPTEGVPDSHQCGKYLEFSHFDLFGGAPGAQNDFKIPGRPCELTKPPISAEISQFLLKAR